MVGQGQRRLGSCGPKTSVYADFYLTGDRAYSLKLCWNESVMYNPRRGLVLASRCTAFLLQTPRDEPSASGFASSSAGHPVSTGAERDHALMFIPKARRLMRVNQWGVSGMSTLHKIDRNYGSVQVAWVGQSRVLIDWFQTKKESAHHREETKTCGQRM